MKNSKNLFTTQNMVVIALLSAAATVLYLFIEVPIIPFAPHLKVNFADVPALIGGLVISPFASVFILLIRCVLHLFRTNTMGIGEAVDFFIGLSILLPFIFIYKKMDKKFKMITSYLIASLITVICAIIGGIIANLIFYPIFMALLGKGIESPQIFFTYLIGTVITNIVRSAATLFVCPWFLPLLTRLKNILKSNR